MGDQALEAQPQVRMNHPDLPGQEIRVPASAAGFHRNAGWHTAEGETNQGEQLPAELQRFEGQQQVRLYHPELDRFETFAESAVPHWRSRGWIPAEEAAERQNATLEAKTVEELRDLARQRGVKVSGTKDELVTRLREGESDQPTQQPEQQSPEQDGQQPEQDPEPSEPQAEPDRAQATSDTEE